MRKKITVAVAALLILGFSSMVLWKTTNLSTPVTIGKSTPELALPTLEIASTTHRSPVLGKEISGLPEYCADKLISVSGCDGMTEITSEQGNTYRLVEIGDQCWFADNLKEIPTTDQGWYGFYENAKDELSQGEGMLYTWDAAMNGASNERSQGVCPDGWHIPTSCEYQSSMLENSSSAQFDREVSIVTYNHELQLVLDKNNSNHLWTSDKHRGSIWYTSVFSPIQPLDFIPEGSKYNATSLRCILD